MIVRTRADADSVEPSTGDTTRREAALTGGAQIVSTDYPAQVSTYEYYVEIPGGTPTRCNPVTAPAVLHVARDREPGLHGALAMNFGCPAKDRCPHRARYVTHV